MSVIKSKWQFNQMVWWGWVVLLFFLSGQLGQAQDSATPLASPTPNADGLILITVQPNDSLWAIAARAGIPLTELLELNGFTPDHIIQPGDQLIIGSGPPPVTATPDVPTPTVTPTRPPPPPSPTPVPPPPTAVCVQAFIDLNQNGVKETTELLRSGVAFTIFNETQVFANYITTGRDEPFCLDNIRPGAYKITRSVRPNETLTTPGDWALTLGLGDEVVLDFGSYTEAEAVVLTLTPFPATRETAVVGATPDAAVNNQVAADPTPAGLDHREAETPASAGNRLVLAVALVVMLTIASGALFFIYKQWRQASKV